MKEGLKMFTKQPHITQKILDLVWNNTNDVVFTIGYDGRLLSTNPAFKATMGWDEEDLNTDGYFPFFSIIAKEKHDELLELLKLGQDIPYYETKRIRKDGRVLEVLASYRAINQGEILAVGMYKDFTEQLEIGRKLQASEESYRNLVEFIPDAIFVERDGKIIFVNQSALTLVGAKSIEQLIGKSVSQLVVEKDSHEFHKQLGEAASTHQEIVEQLCCLDGTLFWGEIVTMRNYFNGDEVLQILVRDITAQKNHEEQLEYLAFHDPLTGLSNRRYFTDQINQAIEQATTEEKMLGIMYIDIDKFKGINDSLGHDVGDQLLKQFADRLKENVREEDILCRNGGDEFLVLLNGIKDKKDAATIASRLNIESQKSFLINNKRIETSCSIGIALFPQDGINSKTLILHSDEALYKAKINRNSYQFYK